MRILIDADACPKKVKDICVDTAKNYKLELIMVVDSAHELSGDFTTITVSKGADAVDREIVKISKKGDILITQDYALATILIDKLKGIINPHGFLYTKFNIDRLMFQRHVNKKKMNSGKRVKGAKKRDEKQDTVFKETLIQVIDKGSI